MDLAELANNEDFKGLPKEEQRKVMMQNTDFSSLPAPEQDRVIARIPGGFAVPPQGETQLRQGKPVREFLSNIYTPLLEMGGMTLGETAGATTGSAGGPVGTLVGGLKGAGVGYSAGRGAAQALDVATGLSEPPTFTESAKSRATDVGVGATISAGGKVAQPILEAPFRYLGERAAANEIALNKEAARIAEREGFDLTAAQQTGSPGMSRMEMVGRWFLTAGGIFNKRDAQEASKWVSKRQQWLDKLGEPYPGTQAADRAAEAGKVIKDKVDALVKQSDAKNAADVEQVRTALLKSMGSNEPYSELGKSGQEIIKARNAKDFERAGKLYDKARQFLNGDERLAAENLKSTAQKIIDEELKVPASDRNTALISRLKSYASLPSTQEEIAAEMTKDAEIKKSVDRLVAGSKPKNQAETDDLRASILQTMRVDKPYEELGNVGLRPESVSTLRAHFRDAIESADTAARKGIEGGKFMSSKEGGAYKRLQSALGVDEDAFAAQVGGEYQRDYTMAKAFYKKKTNFWQDKDVVKMMTEKPEYLLDYVTDAGSKTVPEKFKAAIGPQGVQRFKDRLTSKLFDVDKPGPFNPDAVTRNIAKYGETLASFYSPQEISLMIDAANAAKGMKVANLERNKYFYDLVKKSPDKVASFIMQTENLPMLSKLESVVGKQTMNRVRSTFLANEIELNVYGMMHPSDLGKMLEKYGKNKLEAFLGKDLAQNIVDMNKVGAVTRTVENVAKNPSGTGQALISYFTLIQSGSDLAKGDLWGVIKTLWPPNVIARAYLTKQGTALLAGTAGVPAESTLAAQTYIKLTGILGRDISEGGKYPYKK
ncbi:MAG: hypothetical protein WC736_15900 [Gallionella sp.]|jgi:hypothetical protein